MGGITKFALQSRKEMGMTNIYNILCDAEVNTDQIFADSSNSKYSYCQVELVPLGSDRSRNFVAESATQLWKSSPWGTEEAELGMGTKMVWTNARKKVHQGLAYSNAALALDVSEKLGLGKQEMYPH